MAVIPVAMEIDLRAHEGAERLRDVADRFEQAHGALRQIARGADLESDGATQLEWAEDTLLMMGEVSEWLAESWERLLVAVEAVAADAAAGGALIPKPSFLEALNGRSSSSHSAA